MNDSVLALEQGALATLLAAVIGVAGLYVVTVLSQRKNRDKPAKQRGPSLPVQAADQTVALFLQLHSQLEQMMTALAECEARSDKQAQDMSKLRETDRNLRDELRQVRDELRRLRKPPLADAK